MRSALVIGGTGPTGPYIVNGLVARGFDVTVFHTGAHELAEVDHVPHRHGDVRSVEGVRSAIGADHFDVVVATYGRLRAVAEALVGRTGQLVAIGGVPAYRGYFDATRWDPPGLPVPSREDAPTSTEDDDGKSYRIARTEEILFALHPTACVFRYPYVYGPRQLVPREWLFVRRVLDRRPFVIVPDDGLTLIGHGYTDNLAHAVLLAVDHPEAAAGQVFNAIDEECLTIRQVAELIALELDHDWEIVSMPAQLATPAKPLMQANRTTHRVLDTAKLRQLLGYSDVVPAREAVRRAARWLVEHPPPPGGIEEQALEDPFDYAAEDTLVGWWKSILASAPTLSWVDREPGYGVAYGGPGSTYVRPDTRI